MVVPDIGVDAKVIVPAALLSVIPKLEHNDDVTVVAVKHATEAP